MDKRSFYLSTISDVTEDEATLGIAYRPVTAAVAQKYGLGLELAEYCISSNMDDDTPVRAHFEYNVSAAERRLFHAPYNELLPHAIDEHVRAVAYERYSAAYRLCEDAGCAKFIAHVNYTDTLYHPLWVVPRQVEFWKRFLEEHPGRAVICLENVSEKDPQVILDIISSVNDPRLRMCLDIGHANLTPLDPLEWIRRCAPCVSHYHAHNNKGCASGAPTMVDDTHSALGNGVIPMEQAFGLIMELTPQATVTLETYALEDSVNWLAERGFI